MKPHWLLRSATLRLLWAIAAVVLVVVVVAGTLVERHGYFGLDDGFAFNAWYGFATCIGMIVLAKALGLILERRDDWYDDD